MIVAMVNHEPLSDASLVLPKSDDVLVSASMRELQCLHSALSRCWSFDPYERPSMAKIASGFISGDLVLELETSPDTDGSSSTEDDPASFTPTIQSSTEDFPLPSQLQTELGPVDGSRELRSEDNKEESPRDCGIAGSHRQCTQEDRKTPHNPLEEDTNFDFDPLGTDIPSSFLEDPRTDVGSLRFDYRPLYLSTFFAVVIVLVLSVTANFYMYSLIRRHT